MTWRTRGPLLLAVWPWGGAFARRPAFRLTSAKMGLRFLCARRNHRQRNTTPRLVDFQHPNLDDVANRYHFVRVAHIAIGKLADVHQAAVVQPNIDERAEIT